MKKTLPIELLEDRSREYSMRIEYGFDDKRDCGMMVEKWTHNNTTLESNPKMMREWINTQSEDGGTEETEGKLKKMSK